jgi:hypothetical protein
MLDYYSSHAMPSVKERSASLIEYAIINKIPYTIEIINTIVNETPEYSLYGYSMFGRQEEIKKLIVMK